MLFLLKKKKIIKDSFQVETKFLIFLTKINILELMWWNQGYFFLFVLTQKTLDWTQSSLGRKNGTSVMQCQVFF